MRFGSSNPVFRKLEKENVGVNEGFAQATYAGVALKSLYYLFMAVVGAVIGIYLMVNQPDIFVSILIGSFIVGLITALMSFIKPNWTKVTGTIYCLAEGMLLGTISLLFEAELPGIIISAVAGTFAVVFVVSVLYLTNIVKVTRKFVRFLIIFALSFILSQLVLFFLSLFIPGLSSSFGGGFGIIASVLSCVLAVFYLFFDMEVIRSTVESGQPKYLEWFAAFGIVYTTLWVYIEILRIIAIFSRRS
ncbi:MAG: Bax inhibitor-1/YccA family protein [Bacilli bacterium]